MPPLQLLFFVLMTSVNKRAKMWAPADALTSVATAQSALTPDIAPSAHCTASLIDEMDETAPVVLEPSEFENSVISLKERADACRAHMKFVTKEASSAANTLCRVFSIYTKHCGLCELEEDTPSARAGYSGVDDNECGYREEMAGRVDDLMGLDQNAYTSIMDEMEDEISKVDTSSMRFRGTKDRQLFTQPGMMQKTMSGVADSGVAALKALTRLNVLADRLYAMPAKFATVLRPPVESSDPYDVVKAHVLWSSSKIMHIQTFEAGVAILKNTLYTLRNTKSTTVHCAGPSGDQVHHRLHSIITSHVDGIGRLIHDTEQGFRRTAFSGVLSSRNSDNTTTTQKDEEDIINAFRDDMTTNFDKITDQNPPFGDQETVSEARSNVAAAIVQNIAAIPETVLECIKKHPIVAYGVTTLKACAGIKIDALVDTPFSKFEITKDLPNMLEQLTKKTKSLIEQHKVMERISDASSSTSRSKFSGICIQGPNASQAVSVPQLQAEIQELKKELTASKKELAKHKFKDTYLKEIEDLKAKIKGLEDNEVTEREGQMALREQEEGWEVTTATKLLEEKMQKVGSLMMDSNVRFSDHLQRSFENALRQTQLVEASTRVITTILTNHVQLQHPAITPTLMWDEKRNDLQAQFSRLVVIEVVMWRRLNGLRTTYASDHKRLVTEYNLTLLEFRNAKPVSIHNGGDMAWYVIDGRIKGCNIGKSVVKRNDASIHDYNIRKRLAGHPCMMTQSNRVWDFYIERIKEHNRDQ